MSENSEEMDEIRRALKEMPREDFEYAAWEGFAVTQSEFDLIQQVVGNEELRRQLVSLSDKGMIISDKNGKLDVAKLDPAVLFGTRVDGASFFLQALQSGRFPISKSGERVRSVLKEEGILFTALMDYSVDGKGGIREIANLLPEQLIEMLKTAEVYETDAAIIDATYPLLFPEVRSNELFVTLMTHPLRGGEEIFDGNKLAFRYQGEALWEYLQLAAKQRGGIRWGINREIVPGGKYEFQNGHVPKEIQIQDQHGHIQMEDVAYITTRPSTLERRILEVCQAYCPQE